MDKNQVWDYIIENAIATEDELKLVTCINGFNEDTLNDVIYARTGYHSVDQLEGKDEDDDTVDEDGNEVKP